MSLLKKEKNRREIFRSFLYAERLRFSELLKRTKISSNLLAYFLKKMVKEGALEKRGNFYSLSLAGEKLIPFFVPQQDQISPLVVLLFMCFRKNKIFLVERQKRPYKGLWSLPSGRLLITESLAEGTARIWREKYRVESEMKGVNGVVYERTHGEKEAKHGFVFFIIRVELNEDPKPFVGKWFSLSRIPKKKMIASDDWFIRQYTNTNIPVLEEIMHVKNNTTRMEHVHFS